MSDPTFHDLMIALPPTVAALAGLIVSIINSHKANKIHVLVNSNMTRVQSDLAGANQRIEQLQTVIGKLVDSRAAVLPTDVVKSLPSDITASLTPSVALPLADSSIPK